MILAFSSKFPNDKNVIGGKPTLFLEKILAGLHGLEKFKGFTLKSKFPIDLDFMETCTPKVHTIRRDEGRIWNIGEQIHFVIDPRSKNRYQFTGQPFDVVLTQKIEINYMNEINPIFTKDESKIKKGFYNELEVFVDGNALNIKEIIQLAFNDGFDSAVEFFSYFNKDFSGKIIHWTPLKY